MRKTAKTKKSTKEREREREVRMFKGEESNVCYERRKVKQNIRVETERYACRRKENEKENKKNKNIKE